MSQTITLKVDYVEVLRILLEGTEYRVEDEFVTTPNGDFNSLNIYKGEIEILRDGYTKGDNEYEDFKRIYRMFLIAGIEALNNQFKEMHEKRKQEICQQNLNIN